MVRDRTTRPSWRRGIAFGVLAVLLGVVAFVPLFGVLFTGDLDILAAVALLLYYVFGAAIGYFNRTWWWTSALLAWPCLLFSLNNLALAPSDPAVQQALPVTVIVLVVPLAFALGGGYLGKILAARQPKTRLAQR